MSIQIDNYHLELGLYPDNTPVVNFSNAWDACGGQADVMTVRASSLHEFVTAMFVADSFHERGGKIKNLILPNIPGARQDRIKWEGDMLFTLKSVARMINDRDFNRVITLDPHSLASGMIDRLFIAPLDFVDMFARNGVSLNHKAVIIPDIGAEHRASEAARQLRVPTFQATKTRDPRTNKLSGFKFLQPLIPGIQYLVVDDLCDGGGTFVGLGEEAHKVGDVRLDLYVTHGLFTKGTTELEKHYENIVATDSVEINNPPVKVLEVVEGLKNYV